MIAVISKNINSLRYEELGAVFEFDTGKFVKVSSDIEKIL